MGVQSESELSSTHIFHNFPLTQSYNIITCP